jgi:hypothetical protein
MNGALCIRLTDWTNRLSVFCEPGQLWQIFNKDTNSRAHLHKVLDTGAFLARAFLGAMPRPFCGVRSGLGGADALAHVAMEHAGGADRPTRCRRFRWYSPIKLFRVIINSWAGAQEMKEDHLPWARRRGRVLRYFQWANRSEQDRQLNPAQRLLSLSCCLTALLICLFKGLQIRLEVFNLCGESDKLVVQFDFAKNRWA